MTWWRRVSLRGGAVIYIGQVIRSCKKILYLLYYIYLVTATLAFNIIYLILNKRGLSLYMAFSKFLSIFLLYYLSLS